MSEGVNALFAGQEDVIGETVTIFTESGGASGCGFTGVILRINCFVVRLITCIGPAPGCALGNGCSGSNGIPRGPFSFGCPPPQSCFGMPFTVGSIVDIPIDKIVAIVRNAI